MFLILGWPRIRVRFNPWLPRLKPVAFRLPLFGFPLKAACLLWRTTKTVFFCYNWEVAEFGPNATGGIRTRSPGLCQIPSKNPLHPQHPVPFVLATPNPESRAWTASWFWFQEIWGRVLGMSLMVLFPLSCGEDRINSINRNLGTSTPPHSP